MTKTSLLNLFLIVVGILYSYVVIIGSLLPRGYGPPDHQFTYYENLMLAIPFLHVLLVWLSMIKGRWQKWVVFVNLWMYAIIMSVLLWLLRENDVNELIIVFILLWFVLVTWSILKWRSLRKSTPMNQLNIIFLLVALIIGGCRNDKSQPDTGQPTSRPFPVLVDRMWVEKTLPFYEFETPTSMSYASYGYYYFGKLPDTIYLNPFIHRRLPLYPPSERPKVESEDRPSSILMDDTFEKYFLEWDGSLNFKSGEKSKIEIKLDTATKIIHFFPVMLTNQDADTVSMGYGYFLPLIMEALDSTGVWRPIQEHYGYSCGTGLDEIILPPGECVVTLAPIFQGPYQTKLRLTLGDNISEPFNGFIYYRQFESMFNEHGEYRDEYLPEIDVVRGK